MSTCVAVLRRRPRKLLDSPIKLETVRTVAGDHAPMGPVIQSFQVSTPHLYDPITDLLTPADITSRPLIGHHRLCANKSGHGLGYIGGIQGSRSR